MKVELPFHAGRPACRLPAAEGQAGNLVEDLFSATFVKLSRLSHEDFTKVTTIVPGQNRQITVLINLCLILHFRKEEKMGKEPK